MKIKKILEEIDKKNSYSAVVLDEESRKLLINNLRKMGKLNDNYEIIAHHMTINLGPLKKELADKLGEKIKLTVHSYAEDDRVKAVGVSGFPSKNKNPHITVSVNREIGGRPKHSNELSNWNKIENFNIYGTVKEVE